MKTTQFTPILGHLPLHLIIVLSLLLIGWSGFTQTAQAADGNCTAPTVED